MDVRRGPQPDAARSRCPRARPRRPGCARRSSAACASASPAAVPEEHTHAGRLRGRRHLQDGLPRLLPGHRRPVPLRQGDRHPGRPGPRLGRRLAGRLRAGDHRARPDRAQAAVRAVPQPRAHLDARHRPGLRRAPARRHDPLRHREVRRGAGRADHHVRHDQGQGRGQGRRPRARLPVRGRRPDHQGDAAGGDGQGHPAAGHLRPDAPALHRGRRVPRALRDRPRRQAGRRHRHAGSRASSASGACTPPASSCAASRCSTSSRSMRREQDGAIITQFDMGACETLGLLKMDFLGPAQPHRPRRLPRAHQGQPRRDRRARGRSTRCDDRPTYELLARGDTLGVFQLDGGPMRSLLRSMQPDSFEDISAVLALYRPGPDGRQRAQRLRRPQERPQAGRADPPRAGGAAARRSSATPTA